MKRQRGLRRRTAPRIRALPAIAAGFTRLCADDAAGIPALAEAKERLCII